MNEVEHLLGKELEKSLKFEALMAELSARFINLPADKLDKEIEEAQKVICESVELDRSALFQRGEEGPEKLLLTHLYQHPDAGGPVVERRSEANGVLGRTWVIDRTVKE